MRVDIRLFAVCRDRAGTDRIQLDFPDESVDLDTLRAALAKACPAIAPLLSITRIAVNEGFAQEDQRIKDGDDVALIPPVSGGTGTGPFSVRETPITLEEVEAAVRAPGAGALVSFAGTVRDRTGPHDVEALEYEAYASMAERYLRQIGNTITERWDGSRVAILHRVGRLVVGEVSVVIAVSNPHRGAAFEGCRHAIEELKKDVPIWKKEIRTDGSVWVGVGS